MAEPAAEPGDGLNDMEQCRDGAEFEASPADCGEGGAAGAARRLHRRRARGQYGQWQARQQRRPDCAQRTHDY